MCWWSLDISSTCKWNCLLVGFSRNSLLDKGIWQGLQTVCRKSCFRNSWNYRNAAMVALSGNFESCGHTNTWNVRIRICKQWVVVSWSRIPGPEFIRKPREFWPDDISSDIKEAPFEALIEEKVKVVNLLITKTEKPQPRLNLEQIIDLQRFSSIDKLLRVTSYVIRFVSKLYARSEKSSVFFLKHQQLEPRKL